MTEGASPSDFYRVRVPAQFNRTLAEQRALAGAGDAAAERLLNGMLSVQATIRVEVDGDASYHLNVVSGEMTAEDASTHTPFIVLRHDLESFRVLERESGDSILGFLGGLAGLAEDMKLTSQRIQNLQGLDGSLLFELTGTNAFRIRAQFGAGSADGEPSCKIAVDGESYGRLRSGELGPQEAFLGGQIQVEGDMAMGMQVALAALSPE